MSEEIVKSEPTEQGDEEDDVATPERSPINDFQDVEAAVFTKQEETNETTTQSAEMQSQNQNEVEVDIPSVTSSLANDSVLCSTINQITIPAVVKTEDLGVSTGGTSPTDGQGTVEITPSEFPRIRLVPQHRLSTKTDLFDIPVGNNEDGSLLPQGYFDELLAPVKVESAPANFFDELRNQLRDEEVQIAEMYNEKSATLDLEIKYSEKIKILKQLRDNEKRAKEKKKHKKSKKKSLKRSRPRSSSVSPTPKHMRERDGGALSPPLTVSREQSSTTSDRNKKDIVNPNQFCLEAESPRRLELAPDVVLLDESEIGESVQPHLPVIGQDLTPKQKRDRILCRAKVLASYLKGMKDEENKPLTPFTFTSTVRKLPISHLFYTQNIYENRSPLHTINNVSYEFSSHHSQFNLEEWGLAAMPPLAAKIAKIIGYDAETLHKKLKVTKIPTKIRNIKSEKLDEEEEVRLQSRSSLYCNATTQTDNTDTFSVAKRKGFDVGVQVKPVSHVIACQTLETESPSIKTFDNADNLPIMAIMRQLNENQLLALHEFAELLLVPPTNAMDMYCVRQKMNDIYKCSQLPSALNTPVPASGNSYSTTSGSQKAQSNPSLNRSKSAIQPTTVRHPARDTLHSQKPLGQTDVFQRNRGYQTLPGYSHIQQPPTPGYSGAKSYGRGSLNR